MTGKPKALTEREAKTALHLERVEGMTVKEVADTMRIPYTRMFGELKRLRGGMSYSKWAAQQ